MSNTQNRWLFADEKSRTQLGAEPFARFSSAECVKSNPVRQVLHVPGLYLKLDKRPRHSFETEFQAAQFVKSCGIPAVPHLACGIHEGTAFLITEEAAGACDLSSLAEAPAPPEFLENFALFIKKILQSPVFHPDFHLGNILCQKEQTRFLLIDLHGVRRRTLFDRIFMMHRMYRIILEWREGVSDARLLELLALAGVPNPASFLPRQLAREAAHLKHEFPRRARQILSGYAKFTRREERGLIAAESTELNSPIPCGESRELFCFHFFLKLARIPHTAIAGITPDSSGFYPGKETPFRLPAEDLKKRLSFYNLKVPEKLIEQGFIRDLHLALEQNRKVFARYAR